MQPNEDDRFDTHRLCQSVLLCLTGCPAKSRVTFEGAKSKKTVVKQGVPEGPVLSPLLLLFYINDLQWGSGDLHTSLFADDVAICAQDSKLHIAEKRLQQGLDAVTT